MKTKWLTILFALALGLSTHAQAAKLKIVTTTADLASIAQTVAGDKAEVYSVCSGREDPHMLSARPSVILKARDADLWIRIGLELEIGWEPPILDGSRNTRIRPGTPGHLDVSESVEVLDVPQGTINRAMGDVHPGGNPHYWLDPLNGRRIAGAMADRLALIRPGDAETFRENADKFQRALDERMFGAEALKGKEPEVLWQRLAKGDDIPKLGGWAAAMAPLRGRKIVTYHKSWIYFANRFGLDVIAELEPKPGVPPTAAHLAQVADTAKAGGVKIILQEPFYSRKAADRVAAQIGARMVVVANSVGGQMEATDYLALMDLVVSRVAGANR